MILLAALLVASNPAVASQDPRPDAQQATAAPAKKERKICKADPDSDFTGSRTHKQICMTKSEWARKAAAEAQSGSSN